MLGEQKSRNGGTFFRKEITYFDYRTSSLPEFSHSPSPAAATERAYNKLLPLNPCAERKISYRENRNHRKPEDRYGKVYNRVPKSVIRTTGTGRLRMTRQRKSAVHMRIFRERESRRHKNSTCEGKARGFDRAAACQSARKGHSDIFSTDRTERARPPAA